MLARETARAQFQRPKNMGQHQEHVKNLEADPWHGKEIDGHELLGMISKAKFEKVVCGSAECICWRCSQGSFFKR
jgi:hypothetical protein